MCNEEACWSEREEIEGNNLAVVRLTLVLVYLAHRLGAEIKQAPTSLKTAE